MQRILNLNDLVSRSDISLSAFILGASFSLGTKNLPNLYWIIIILVCLFLWIKKHSLTWPLIAFFLGFCFFLFAVERQQSKQLSLSLEGQLLSLPGEVIGLPSEDESQIKFYFRVLSNANAPSLSGQKIALSCYQCQLPIKANQRWLLSVKLKRPYGYASWGAFDLEKYSFRQAVVGRGYIKQNKDNYLLSNKSSFSIHPLRLSIRDYLNSQFKQSPIAAGMFAALMIGDKSLLSSQQKQVFQKVGLSHLMAISGLHIGLIFAFTVFIFRYLMWPAVNLYQIWPRQYWVLIPGLLVALFYAGLAGFSVSTQRALIMLLVFSACKVMAKQTTLLQVLLLTAVVVIIIDPFSVMDTGFWLSFTAVFIIAINQDRNKNLSLWRLQPLLWLGMLPLSVSFFAETSLISPLINLVMVPVFCLVLIPCVLTGLAFWLCGWLTVSTLLLTKLAVIFEWLFSHLETISHWDWLVWHYPQFAWWHWLIYISIISLYLSRYRWRHFSWFTLLLMMLISNSKPLQTGEFKVTLLDVGQGLSMVIETRNHSLVYDTGPAYPSGFSTAQAVLLPFLKHEQITKLDHLIISHADNDHIGGYPDLVKTIEIKQTLTSRVDRLPNATQCRAGQRWTYDKVLFEILSPDADTPQGSNNHSCVLKISNAEQSLLITGDIEKQVERYLIGKYSNQLQAKVILVPHQGSKTSSVNSFIDAVKPSIALVAAGYRNHYGHPHSDVMQRYVKRGINIYSTIDSGSISLVFKSSNILIKQYRKDQQRFWHTLANH